MSMILNEYLHKLFVQYIDDGRFRAPPESNLKDLIPTFHPGSKVDRRALQSKFKSWSRRMIFEDGYLKLSDSKKLIVPSEKFEELIMSTHSDKHFGVFNMMNQIKERYAWSQKNFGIDKEMIEKAIMKYCKKESCKRKIELARYDFKKRTLGALNPKNYSRIGIPYCKMPTSVQHDTQSHHCRWSTFHPGSMILKKRLVLRSNARRFQEYHVRRDPRSKRKMLPRYEVRPVMSKTSREVIRLVRTCKKPKNLEEFHRLLQAAEDNPADYPAYITSPKTKFLGGFGLVPTRICSQKLLSRLRSALKNEDTVQERCIRHLQRCKALRDRNKINKKRYHKTKKHSYLNPSSSTRNSGCSSTINFGYRKPSVCKNLFGRNSDKENAEPEVIDLLSSSDDDQLKEGMSKTRRPVKESKLNYARPEKNLNLCSERNKPKIEVFKRNSSQVQICQGKILPLKSHDHPQSTPYTYNKVGTENSVIEAHDTGFKYFIKKSPQVLPLPSNPPVIGPEDKEEKKVPASQNEVNALNSSTRCSGLEDFNRNPQVLFYASNPLAVSAASSGESSQTPNLPLSFENSHVREYPIVRPYLIPLSSTVGAALMQASGFPIMKPLQQRIQAPLKNDKSFTNTPILRTSTGTRTYVPIVPRPAPGTENNTKTIHLVGGNMLPLNANVIIPKSKPTLLVISSRASQETKESLDKRAAAAENERLYKIPSVTSFLPNSNPKAPKVNVKKLENFKTKETGPAASSKVKVSVKKDIDEEMLNLTYWIEEMKLMFEPPMFQLLFSSKKLSEHLAVGIFLVKEIRNALMELEKNGE